jgi:hypothetical protein
MNCRRYNSLAMIDKAHLRNKRVIFKINTLQRAFSGTVAYAEDDGFWISAPDLCAEALRGTNLAGEVPKPVIFVPTAQLSWLIASSDEV